MFYPSIKKYRIIIYCALAAIIFTAFSRQEEETAEIIIDSQLTFEQAMAGKEIPNTIGNNMRLIDVKYYSFDGKVHQGQLIIHKDLIEDIRYIFKEILAGKFPIEKVIPISKYDWSDDKSMSHNNTSAFNYRIVKGTKILSAHALGRAIDINPLLNPQIKSGKFYPDSAVYDRDIPGTISYDSRIVKVFKKRGWSWGGNWRSTKDYQHFEKK
jgi:peptidoglycan LD-endopeptidase CwlK